MEWTFTDEEPEAEISCVEVTAREKMSVTWASKISLRRRRRRFRDGLYPHRLYGW